MTAVELAVFVVLVALGGIVLTRLASERRRDQVEGAPTDES